MFTYNQKTDPPAFQGCGANVFNSCNDISIIPLNIRKIIMHKCYWNNFNGRLIDASPSKHGQRI